MKRNIGKTDRTIRLVVGLIVFALGVVLESWPGLVGLVLVGTSVVRWCPLYAPFGFSTYKEPGTASRLQHS